MPVNYPEEAVFRVSACRGGRRGGCAGAGPVTGAILFLSGSLAR